MHLFKEHCSILFKACIVILLKVNLFKLFEIFSHFPGEYLLAVNSFKPVLLHSHFMINKGKDIHKLEIDRVLILQDPRINISLFSFQ